MTEKGFKTIIFTSPDDVEDEVAKINMLLEAGIDWLHIRKPQKNEEEIIRMLDQIDPKYYPRIRLHDFFPLAARYEIGGVHLNSRNPHAPTDKINVSASCHTIREIFLLSHRLANPIEYMTLSPIFDSISKTGYLSAFDLEELSPDKIPDRVVALGGIRPEHYELLQEKGFYGAGLLGYIWEGDFSARLSSLSEYIKKE